MGFTTPTPIQEQAIPKLISKAQDFIGLAQTGTGKTAAFGLPLLELIDPDLKQIQGLILAPTRELTQQIAEQMAAFARDVKLHVDVVYGGTPIYPQIKRIKSKIPQILVATPGRLIDLAERKAIRLDHTAYVVLDEADEMLNMGFRDELDKILSFTPKEKLTWLFSATMPSGIKALTKKYMEHPCEVKVSSGVTVNANIEHQYTVLKKADKPEALRRFIDVNPELYGVVFCRTKVDTQHLSDALIVKGYKVEAIHGDLSQSQRDIVMKRFKKGHLQALIATDVAARGIDVKDLTHVIHYDLPDGTEYYTHRSGRTARAGQTGISLAFVGRNEQKKIKGFAGALKIEFKKMEVPDLEDVMGLKVTTLTNDLLRKDVSQLYTPTLRSIAEEILADTSATEVLAAYLSRELEQSQYEREARDLNDHRSDQNSDRGKNGNRKRGRSGEEGYHRFFINIGRTDKMEKGDLLRTICDVTNLIGNNIGAIRMFERHSVFDVDNRHSAGVAKAFEGALVNNRSMRVNRDDEGGNRKGGGNERRDFGKGKFKAGKKSGHKDKNGNKENLKPFAKKEKKKKKRKF